MKAVAAYVYAGGFSVGVRRAGYDVLCHLEGDNGYGVPDAKLNWPEMPIYFGPSRWPLKELSDFGVDFVYANPPCAIFSAMGIRTTRGADGWRTDPRLDHWWDSFRALEQIRPKAWALESVTQAYTTGRGVVDEMTKRALMMGYSVTHLFISAQNHGIPQDRKRFFLVAHKQPALEPFPLNWSPPPTVGEAMAEVDDPGEYTPLNENHRLALRECKPGEQLCNAWMRLNPNYTENRNDRGQVIGRPSFQDRRLDPKEVMGAFVGDKYFHWEYERLLGVNEMKALCGYPLDFKLAPPQRGWPSMLARAVMPPVGEWLARSIALTLNHPDGAWGDRRVRLIDVRRQGLEPQDLTSQYLENGRVRIRVRADGSWASSIPVPVPVEVSQERVESIGASVVPPAAFVALSPAPAPAFAPLTVVGNGTGATPVSSVPIVIGRPQLPPSTTAPSPNGSGVVEVTGSTAPPSTSFVDPQYAKRPGEGSGVFAQRLWMDTQLSPEAICDLIHQNWSGRTTKVGDVRYNFYKLMERATEDPNQPGVFRLADGRVVRPWPTATRTKRETKPVAPRQVRPTAPTSAGTNGNGAEPTIVPSGPLVSKYNKVILVTGCTPIQIGSDRTKHKIVTSVAPLVNALTELGYLVDWRPVTIGDDVSRYDRCVVFVSSFKQIVAIKNRYMYGAIWVLSQRPDAVLALDDHETFGLVSDARSITQSRERAFRFFDQFYGEEKRGFQDILFQTLNEFAGHHWSRKVLAPIQGNGNLSKLGVPATIVGWDPTAFAFRYPSTTVTKERRWVAASLSSASLPATGWPVAIYGNAGRGQGVRVTEEEVAAEYDRSWGVIAPPNRHPGSGWWRARYYMAAQARCIVSGHHEEAKALGPSYVVASDVRNVERLNEQELHALARSQAEELANITCSKDQVLTILRDLLSSSGPLANGGAVPNGHDSRKGVIEMPSTAGGEPPAPAVPSGWAKATVSPEYRGTVKRALLYYSQLPERGSVAAPISSARIAWFLQENLTFDKVYHSNDYPTDVLPDVIDDLWVVNSSWFYNKDEWRKIAMRLFRHAKRVIFCQNDYAMVISSYQLGAMRDETEYVLLTTCLDLPIQQKHGLIPIHVNWNVLTYEPRPKTDADRRDGIYYYGSLRAGRSGVFDKYFKRPSPILTVSASSPNDVNQFRDRYPELNVVGRADRGVVEELETWAATLILEDKRSIESFVSPPNRFYEALSARCPMVFDPDSIPMWRRYGYDIEPFVVHGPADLPRVLEVAGEFGAAQEEWQRDYLGELAARFWEVVPTMTGRRGAPESLKRYALHEDGGEW